MKHMRFTPDTHIITLQPRSVKDATCEASSNRIRCIVKENDRRCWEIAQERGAIYSHVKFTIIGQCN